MIKKGFTLIELLLVIAIIGVLMSVTLIAIKPSLQIAKSNDAQRTADVRAIADSLWQYAIENGGNFPLSLASGAVLPATNICLGSGTVQCAGLLDVYSIVGQYIVEIPSDPKYSSGFNSEYTLSKAANGKITVSAPRCELSNCSISITR